jgi:hypothetical protein
MLGSGANVSMSYVLETEQGVTPTVPVMKTFRATGRNINPARATITSGEVRADRQVSDMRHGFQSVAGSFGFQLGLQDFDDVLEGELSGTWALVTTGTVSLSATAAGYARTAGSFITDGFEVGDIVEASGFSVAANNGRGRVSAVSALLLTVEDEFTGAAYTAVDGAAGGRFVNAVGQKLKVGKILRTFTMERRFSDVARYQLFKGCAFNNMSLTIAPNVIIGGTIDVVGLTGGDILNTTLGNPQAPTANEPFASFDGVLLEGGEDIGIVTGMTINMANGRSTAPVVFRRTSPAVFEGTFTVTGQVTVFFEDGTLVEKFINEETSSIDVRLDDVNGTDFHRIRLGRIKYTGAPMDPPQQGPITLTMPYQALVDPASGSTVVWQRSNVA